MDGFYGRHSYNDRMYNADMIYTPDVTVFKSSDSVPVLRPREEWFNVDVITMAAPDISMMRNKPSDYELLKVFEERFTHIMGRAAEHGVDVLILGAFGCGMFGNDPFLVAVASVRVPFFLFSFLKRFTSFSDISVKKSARSLAAWLQATIMVKNFAAKNQQYSASWIITEVKGL